MTKRKKAVTATIIFVAVILVCTFFSRTVYYFTLPKVTVDSPKSGAFTEKVTLSQGTLRLGGAVSQKLELPSALRVEEIFVSAGDTVKEGAMLLRFDSDSVAAQVKAYNKAVESAEIALSDFQRGFNLRVEKLRESIPDGISGGLLSVRAESGGIVTNLKHKAGDRVSAGDKLCEIAENGRLILRLPYSDSYDITAGMPASVSIPSMMSAVSGSVTEVGGRMLSGGVYARMVTIELTNPGTLTAGLSASAQLEGDISPMEDGTLEYLSVKAVTAEAAGYVYSLEAGSGESIAAGGLIMKIELPDSSAEQEELDYMLTTGIYNGKTENQLRTALEEAESSLKIYERLSENAALYAENDGVISALNASKGSAFAGGTVVEYAAENAAYQLILASGDMSRIEPGQRCTVIYYVDGRQSKANGQVGAVSAGGVTVESSGLSDAASQASGFYAEVTVSSTNAAMTVPLSAMVSSDKVYVVSTRKTVLGTETVLELREVSTGLSDSSKVEIISGLYAGQDKVVTSWDRALSDGATVEIMK